MKNTKKHQKLPAKLSEIIELGQSVQNQNIHVLCMCVYWNGKEISHYKVLKTYETITGTIVHCTALNSDDNRKRMKNWIS